MKNSVFTFILIISLICNGYFAFKLFGETPETNTTETGTSSEKTLDVAERVTYESGKSYPFMRVVDGDTLVIGFENKTQYVRLIGIDSPEPNDPGGPQCYALEATNYMKEITQTGLVVLHFDESQGMHDSYGRLLAYVELPDGTDVGKKMLEDGYAREFTYNSEYNRQASYLEAEALALEEQRGLWGDAVCD